MDKLGKRLTFIDPIALCRWKPARFYGRRQYRVATKNGCATQDFRFWLNFAINILF